MSYFDYGRFVFFNQTVIKILSKSFKVKKTDLPIRFMEF
ncbi:hypothetical protein LEP1GSC060_3147 [Leptospira weilii serovar Ranarum str. ICFT]|uniref:Uncharacterized protein n=1 Tax=Leptospira weilii serovar Ranarum str. ICFT TaxID=1218598 RepID=N1WI87_9LEPT|nr:hypothetical protein LEP1GSC060_3147 [Leptospira weilii serovar Ranarum str. ICFT]